MKTKKNMNYSFSKKCIKFLLFLFIITISALAKGEPSESSQQDRTSLVALPFAFYTPETKIAFGVGSIYSFRSAGSKIMSRPSNVKASATYTQLKQIILAFIPEIYFKNEAYYFNGWYAYYKFPDKFWGIGNKTPDNAEEAYEPNYLRTFTNIQKRFLPGFYLGFRYQYENIKLKNTDVDGVLQYETIPGSEGGVASGLGFLVSYDTRNNIYFPTQGSFHQAYIVFFDQLLGSDYQFNLYTLDLRKYYSIFNSQVAGIPNA